MQKKIKSNSIKQLFLLRELQDLGSNTDDSEDIQYKKTVVLEPEDLIFTILDNQIEGASPNLVFEQKDIDGNMATYYMYLNQSYKPFLHYLCQKFEVIIYSRIKIGLLNQIMNQIKAICPLLSFSTVLGKNSCSYAKLVNRSTDNEVEKGIISEFDDNSAHTLEFTLKNINKVVKTRGKENVIFIDNSLYSYINYLDLYIPVPKFKGNENFNLFFLKFYLEDYLNGRDPICNVILDNYSC